MPPLWVVEHLDVIDDVTLCLFTGLVAHFVDSFSLHAPEEAFGYGVVPAVALFAHRATHLVAFQELLEFPGAVLTATVGVKDQALAGLSAPDGHFEGVGDKACFHAAAHRPANDFA